MRTIVSLLIVGLVLNACLRASMSAWQYYQLKDGIEAAVRFGSETTTSQVHQRVLKIAEEHGVALGPEDIVVERRGEQTYVRAGYADAIPLIPQLYTRQHHYDIEVKVVTMRPLTVDDKRR